MKKFGFLLLLLSVVLIVSCDKDDEMSERFRFLTTPVWESDSLLVNGLDASAPSGLLEDFRGEVIFDEDGTGHYGDLTGTWEFMQDETQLAIRTEALPFALITDIVELTANSLKITTEFPNPENPTDPQDKLKIRMTFKAK